jgi:hypothetical protein
VVQHSPTFPCVSGEVRDPIIEVDHAAWQQIEKACGWSIPTDLRSTTVRVTQHFLLFDAFERTAKPFAAAKVTLEAYDKAAGRFFHALFTEPSGSPEAGMFAHHLIEANFKKSLIAGDAAVFDALLTLLKDFHLACNLSLKQLNDPLLAASGDSNAWRSWVWRLTKLIEKAGLPASVGKSAESEKPSSFLRFVGALQEYLPQPCRRHTDSEKALANAIREVQSMARKLGILS